MNENNKQSLEQLVLYHENLLSSRERREVEKALVSDPEVRHTLDELKSMDQFLEEWGQKERMATTVVDRLSSAKSSQNLIHQKHAKSAKPFRLPTFFDHRLVAGMAVALIVVVLGLVYTFQMNNQSARLLIAKGEKYSIETRDQDIVPEQSDILVGNNSFLRLLMGDQKSIVELSPNSLAKINGSRSIVLTKGKLWTEVAKDSNNPYKVITPHGTITVLGTKFEVVVEEENTKVFVTEGLIRIESDSTSQKEEKVEEGQTGIITKTSLSTKHSAPTEIAHWRKRFVNTNLGAKDIADALHR